MIVRNFSVLLMMLVTPDLSVADEWPSYGGDLGGNRFSELTQINRDNVGSLELAWTYRTGEFDDLPDFFMAHSIHATPILTPEAAGRSLIFCTAFNRIVALNASTGEEKWVFDPEVALKRGGQYKCRAVSLWHDKTARPDQPCTWRVYTATTDRRLFAVDAKTGRRCKGFGRNGEVDFEPLIRAAGPPGEGHIKDFHLWSPPAIIGDIVAVSSTLYSKTNAAYTLSGQIRGFDARTGALKWWFDPVPRNPNDPQAKNWSDEALQKTGGANVWGFMSVDEKRDLLFLPTAGASPDYYGGTRPGDNRYATSLVALRGSTGEVVWHFQLTHHDVWNYDPAAQPILASITRDDAISPVAIQLTKSGFAFVFDRETGEPFFGVEERPVPTGGVPGEVLSPTQPFPVAPPPLVPQNITPDDAWGFTLYDKAACRAQIESLRYGPIYTPPTVQGTVFYPKSGGGVNWGGGAYDPSRNLLITNVARVPNFVRLIPTADLDQESDNISGAFQVGGATITPIDGTPYSITVRPIVSPLNLPCTAPPWGTLIAVDMDKGTIKWEVPLGSVEKYAPFGLPFNWGMPPSGGPMVTAGGLIFIGATPDEKFRAFDIETGQKVWEVRTPSSSMAIPMTYQVDGRQYVVVASGGHQFMYRNITDHIVAYALPDK